MSTQEQIDRRIEQGKARLDDYARQGDWEAAKKELAQTAVDCLQLQRVEHERVMRKIDAKTKVIERKLERVTDIAKFVARASGYLPDRNGKLARKREKG